MDRETITAESLLRDIYEAESALRWFEQKYGLLSETFYRVYQQGQLRDEDLDEIQEYMEWSGWYEISQDRRQRYEQAVEQRLRELVAPASLLDLHISQLHVPS
jgi:hypothetical protein